jgi:hypothetical protein
MLCRGHHEASNSPSRATRRGMQAWIEPFHSLHSCPTFAYRCLCLQVKRISGLIYGLCPQLEPKPTSHIAHGGALVVSCARRGNAWRAQGLRKHNADPLYHFAILLPLIALVLLLTQLENVIRDAVCFTEHARYAIENTHAAPQQMLMLLCSSHAVQSQDRHGVPSPTLVSSTQC